MKTKDFLIDLVLTLIFILVLSLFFDTYAQDPIFCGEKSHAEIDACSVDDKMGVLLKRLYPNHVYKSLEAYNAVDECVPVEDNLLTPDIDESVPCPVWVDPKINAYTFEDFSESNPKGVYDRLIMIDKPSIIQLDNELAAWRIEIKAEVDWRNRVYAQDDSKLRFKMIKCGFNQPNLKVFLNDIFKNKDTVKLDCLESKDAEVNAEIEQAQLKEANRENALDRIKNYNCASIVGQPFLKDLCELYK